MFKGNIKNDIRLVMPAAHTDLAVRKLTEIKKYRLHPCKRKWTMSSSCTARQTNRDEMTSVQ